MIVSIGLVASAWQAVQLKVLGFGSAAPIPRFPEVPTLAESGLPGYEAGSWYGFVAPKGTPAEIVQKLNMQTQTIFADEAFRDNFLAPSFISSIASPPAQFAKRIQADSEKWAKVTQDANVHVD